MKRLLLASTAVFALTVTSAQAMEIKPYVGVNLDYGLTSIKNTNDAPVNDTFKPRNLGLGLVGGAAMPLPVGAFRPELEFAYNFSGDDSKPAGGQTNKVEYSSYSFLVNLYYDYQFDGTPFNVFVGPSLGFTRGEVEISTTQGGGMKDKKSSTEFAWGLGAGVGYRLNANNSIDFTVRYLNLGEVSYTNLFDAGIDGKVENSQLQMKLGYKFWF